MYQAAIVEDERLVREYLRDSFVSGFQEKNILVAFDLFESGASFLDMFEEHYHYDIIFLDIEMPQMDGITLCRRIRQLSPNALVIFISNREELVFQSFEVQPFRFIRKSQFQDFLPNLIDALIEKLNEQSKKQIQFVEPLSGDIFSFDVQQILYVEAQKKDCRIVTTTESTLIHYKFMDMEERLTKEAFIKVHRSYLVNCKYIFYIGKDSLVLTTKEEIPMSRRRAEEIKEQFLQYSMHSY